jgi:hypothetical protein
MAYSRANRSLCDTMRQHYERLIAACESADSIRSGYLSPHGLWKILNDVVPLRYEDLRLMLKQVTSTLLSVSYDLRQFQPNASGDYHYRQVLAPYHPSTIPPHGLENPQNSPSPSLTNPPQLKKSQSEINLRQMASQSQGAPQGWEDAFRACKSLDKEQCGFISQKKFLTILSQSHGAVRLPLVAIHHTTTSPSPSLPTEPFIGGCSKYHDVTARTKGGEQVIWQLCLKCDLNKVSWIAPIAPAKRLEEYLVTGEGCCIPERLDSSRDVRRISISSNRCGWFESSGRGAANDGPAAHLRSYLLGFYYAGEGTSLLPLALRSTFLLLPRRKWAAQRLFLIFAS